RDELALQDLLGERILDLLLDGALERPRPVHRIEARLAEKIARGIIERHVHVALLQTLAQVHELDVDDRADLLRAERMEHHDVIDAIDELRAETLPDNLHYGAFHLAVVLLAGILLNDL